MLLGLSGLDSGEDVDPTDLESGAGVKHGELLVRFVNATFESAEELAAVRDECVAALGYPATIDAAAVVANFHMMTRIADGTGTPLDQGSADMTGELRDALGLNDLESTRFDPTAAG